MISRRMVLGVLLGFVLSTTGCGMERARQAKNRVHWLLEGLQKDGGGDGGYMQQAICQWKRGKDILPMNELDAAMGQFRDWAKERDLYRKIGSYEITDASPESGSDAVVVSFTVEGKPMQVRVVPHEPLEWIE